MSHISYQHIGHDPQRGEIALWALDERWRLHEQRRAFDRPDAEWLDWSHERLFGGVNRRAHGRVELSNRTGTLHIADTAACLCTTRLTRVLDALDAQYPGTRWFLFGPLFRGESALAALAARLGEVASPVHAN